MLYVVFVFLVFSDDAVVRGSGTLLRPTSSYLAVGGTLRIFEECFEINFDLMCISISVTTWERLLRKRGSA